MRIVIKIKVVPQNSGLGQGLLLCVIIACWGVSSLQPVTLKMSPDYLSVRLPTKILMTLLLTEHSVEYIKYPVTKLNFGWCWQVPLNIPVTVPCMPFILIWTKIECKLPDLHVIFPSAMEDILFWMVFVPTVKQKFLPVRVLPVLLFPPL